MIQRGSRLRSSLVVLGCVCGGGLSGRVICVLMMGLLLMLSSVSSLVYVSESLFVSVSVVDSSSECFVWINSLLVGPRSVGGDGLCGRVIRVILIDSLLVLSSSLGCVSESLIVSVSVVSSVSDCFWLII